MFDRKAAEFWDKENPKVMGDFRARPQAVYLAMDGGSNDLRGKRILDAGCGTGYLSRMLAARGAEVFACDQSEEMLAKAIKNNSSLTKKIKFSKQDITNYKNFDDNFFDTVMFVGVLMYTSNLNRIMNEAYRIAKTNAQVIVSVTHPELYEEGSPARIQRPCWLELDKNPGSAFSDKPVFTQRYKDIEGKIFQAQVINHSEEDYVRAVVSSGFTLTSYGDIYTNPEDFKHPSWGKPKNYKAYWQITGRKNDV